MLIEELNLRRPIYRQTAAYGHFGRTGKDFTWEQTPRLDELRSAVGQKNGSAHANGASQGASKRSAPRAGKGKGKSPNATASA
jgi:hypothetical protein